jgi:hypothetical protein
MDTHEFSIMKPAYGLMTLVMLLMALAGCAGNETQPGNTTPPAVTTTGPSSLTPQARAALDLAEAIVEQARSAHALWTTADSALSKAREAAQAGDSAMVLLHAKTAADQARLGLAQKNYPSTEK